MISLSFDSVTPSMYQFWLLNREWNSLFMLYHQFIFVPLWSWLLCSNVHSSYSSSTLHDVTTQVSSHTLSCIDVLDFSLHKTLSLLMLLYFWCHIKNQSHILTHLHHYLTHYIPPPNWFLVLNLYLWLLFPPTKLKTSWLQFSLLGLPHANMDLFDYSHCLCPHSSLDIDLLFIPTASIVSAHIFFLLV